MTDETQVETPVEDAPVSPVEAADSSPAPEAQPETEPTETVEQPRDEEGKFLSPKVQKRIDHLTWEKNQREREAEYWRQLALQSQPKPEPKAEEVKLPTLEEHGFDEAKYQAALIEYATKQAEQVVERRLTEAEKQRAEKTRLESFASRQQEFAKSTPDYQAKISDPTLPITEAMRDVIVDSPSGPELAYYLADHRDVAEQIARLPAHLAALELGRIDGRLSAQKEAKRKPIVTQAPPPPPKVEDVEVPVAGIKASSADSDKLSNAEWLRLREKELQRKKG